MQSGGREGSTRADLRFDPPAKSTGHYFKAYFKNPDSVQIGTMVSVLEIVSRLDSS